MPGVVLAPTRSVPCARPSSSDTACRASPTEATMCAACGAKARPASVRVTRRPARSKSFAPISRSSSWMCSDRVGCESGMRAAALAVLAGVRVFTRGTSLGGVESLIEHRRTTEGASSPIPADLLRLSIGLESPIDLIADLSRALESVPAAARTIPPDTIASPENTGIRAAVIAAVERTVTPTILPRMSSA
ncbi:MAG: PLP-dependent transferase [Candidatus Rokubacteria bacterium]|nr:PLP-dependent transferase [Candidatus Rokubacteria bacterium]